MHAYAIIEVSAGRPNVNFSTTPVAGYVLAAGPIGNYGLYLVGGSAAQLAAVNALPNVVGLVAMDESGGVKWSQLNNTISTGFRTKINNWLAARGYPERVPTGWTYRQVLTAVVTRLKRVGDDWDLNKTWVKDVT